MLCPSHTSLLSFKTILMETWNSYIAILKDYANPFRKPYSVALWIQMQSMSAISFPKNGLCMWCPSPWNCPDGFWVIASGTSVDSACRGIFGGKIWVFIQRKSSNQLCGLSRNEPEFNFNINFVTLNDLDHVTWRCFFFDPVWLRMHLWFLIFTPQNISPLNARQCKKVRFSSFFSIWPRSNFCQSGAPRHHQRKKLHMFFCYGW